MIATAAWLVAHKDGGEKAKESPFVYITVWFFHLALFMGFDLLCFYVVSGAVSL